MAERTVVGCMTGTSIDALDAAVVRLRGSGLSMSARVVQTASWPLGDLAGDLRAAAEQRPASAGWFASLAHRFGAFHAERLGPWLEGLGLHPDFACVHGQTVFHAPPASWQLIDPAPVARRLACPVVFDLRSADLAAGGQGAPITPLADWVLFREAGTTRAVVNLGGFCNITLLPAGAGPEGVRGFDACACNQVLDACARTGLGKPFDEDGRAARSGTVHPEGAAELMAALTRQRSEGRSLGTGDEAGAWAERWSARLNGPDLCATACEGVGRAVADACAGAEELVLAGGGERNRALVGAIERSAGLPIRTTDDLGVPASHREAAAMAVLGALCVDGVAITLPQVTGCAGPAPLSGSWCGERPSYSAGRS